MRVMLATACGAKKEDTLQPAGKLYKSARVRHLYRRSKELGIPFYVLSAKYGLVDGDQLIGPYDAVLTPKQARELLPQVISVVKNYDVVIYYKGGARKGKKT
jgi:hypothetical protein